MYSLKKFPVNVFPKLVSDLLIAAEKSNNFPVAYTATSLLTVVSVLLGNKFSIKVKEGWTENPILYSALIGEPGTSKTHSINFVTKLLWKVNDELKAKYDEELHEYNSLPQEEKDRKPKPTTYQLIISDFTPEVLPFILQRNQNGVMILNDEIQAMINNMNRYNNGNMEQMYLSLFSHQPISVNRKSHEPIIIENAFVSILGGIQPARLHDFLSNGRDDDGFLDRFIFAIHSNNAAFRWNDNSIDEALSNPVADLIYNVFKIDENILIFEDALTIWENWFNYYQNRIHKEPNVVLKRIMLKHISIVPRLALILEVLHSIANGNSDALSDYGLVSKKSLFGAFKLMDYYNSSISRVLSLIRSTPSNDPRYNIAVKLKQELKLKTLQISRLVGISNSTLDRFFKKVGNG